MAYAPKNQSTFGVSMRGQSRSGRATAACDGRAPAVSIRTSLLSPSAVPYASLDGRWLQLSPRGRPGGSPPRTPRVRRAAGRVRAGGAARAVRDVDPEHGGRADGLRTDPDPGRRQRRRTGDRPSRRHARALPRGRRARLGRAPGFHARAIVILDRAIVRLLPAVPRPVVQKLSERYIAGAELKDARETVRRLNAQEKMATIDVLGEEITNEDEAAAIVRAYLDVFADIERCKLDSNVSVKLTGLGLTLGHDICRANLETVVVDAASRGNFVRIDMEDSSTTDDTLQLYRELRAAGHDNVGVVLQATLRRTLSDIRDLADLRPSVRLCKGIYVEPPEIAYRDFGAVRANYVRSLEALLDAGSYVGIATHDEWLVGEGKRLVKERGLEPAQYEFQMLLGVRDDLGGRLVRERHRLRIYVPFGRDWYEYSIRRLQENPRIAGYIAADTIGRFVPGRRNGA
ncbi:MAG: hypothetical protein E6G64_05540 [Actinobacteria bacterium]|nr:MAG: hypothetical protein E6G64_05540 [Actinomycetota bacterium]